MLNIICFEWLENIHKHWTFYHCNLHWNARYCITVQVYLNTCKRIDEALKLFRGEWGIPNNTTVGPYWRLCSNLVSAATRKRVHRFLSALSSSRPHSFPYFTSLTTYRSRYIKQQPHCNGISSIKLFALQKNIMYFRTQHFPSIVVLSFCKIFGKLNKQSLSTSKWTKACEYLTSKTFQKPHSGSAETFSDQAIRLAT